MPTRVIKVEPLGVGQLVEVYAKIELEVVEEQVHARDRHKASCKKSLKGEFAETSRSVRGLKALSEVIYSGATIAEGPNAAFVKDGAKVAGSKMTSKVGQTVEEKRSRASIPKRAIRENVALGLKPELDNEGRGPVELKLVERLPDVLRELRDLEKRICLINECSAWLEYQYHIFRVGAQLKVGRHHVKDMYGAVDDVVAVDEARQGLEAALVKIRVARDAAITEVKEAKQAMAQAKVLASQIFKQAEALRGELDAAKAAVRPSKEKLKLRVAQLMVAPQVNESLMLRLQGKIVKAAMTMATVVEDWDCAMADARQASKKWLSGVRAKWVKMEELLHALEKKSNVRC
ncbi:hypothetical protein ACLOJK_027822 [Asimina triloba]